MGEELAAQWPLAAAALGWSLRLEDGGELVLRAARGLKLRRELWLKRPAV